MAFKSFKIWSNSITKSLKLIIMVQLIKVDNPFPIISSYFYMHLELNLWCILCCVFVYRKIEKQLFQVNLSFFYYQYFFVVIAYIQHKIYLLLASTYPHIHINSKLHNAMSLPHQQNLSSLVFLATFCDNNFYQCVAFLQTEITNLYLIYSCVISLLL